LPPRSGPSALLNEVHARNATLTKLSPQTCKAVVEFLCRARRAERLHLVDHAHDLAHGEQPRGLFHGQRAVSVRRFELLVPRWRHGFLCRAVGGSGIGDLRDGLLERVEADHGGQMVEILQCLADEWRRACRAVSRGIVQQPRLAEEAFLHQRGQPRRKVGFMRDKPAHACIQGIAHTNKVPVIVLGDRPAARRHRRKPATPLLRRRSERAIGIARRKLIARRRRQIALQLSRRYRFAICPGRRKPLPHANSDGRFG